ncbi:MULTISPECIES: hypothetical protein [unclassified Rhizobium]|uniref:hypothetical protein n=1 Tax=unclassified Rhizobium TaxID=2613769 RepID=UPI0007EBA729|nr:MULTISPECIES: hypothetical protein [unclassified Rhizobium]ANL11969.1 hypothetical protein AMJ98_PA00023 [Rhizobium sp. N1341]ANM42814.1 hypothetical protein AMK03_PA00023 [Rhizobium sp. N741]
MIKKIGIQMTALAGNVPDEEFERLIDRDEQIGNKGTSRIVFAVHGRSDLVIKESHQPFHHSNFVEWTVWYAIQKMADPEIMGNEPNSELRQQFAQCFAISHSARFLMMERLLPLELGEAQQFIPKLPSWLNDRKPSALGKTAQGEIKVLDYGAVNFYEVLNPKNKGGGYFF